MSQTFLCATHRLWLNQNPDAAVTHFSTTQDTAQYYRDVGDWQEALPYLGCAYETAEIVLGQHRLDPLIKVISRDISDDETISIYQAAGYSKDFLEKLRKKFENKCNTMAEKDAYLDKVLANYPGKSTTKPKKAKLRARFATMMRNKNVIKLSDLEDDKLKEEDGENEKDEG